MLVRCMRGITLKGHRKKTGGEGGREDRGRKEKNTGKTGKNKKTNIMKTNIHGRQAPT